MDNDLSAASSPPVAEAVSAMVARRAKSAGVFPSAARKLFIPSSTAAPVAPFRCIAVSPSSPACARYQSRLSAKRGPVSMTGPNAASPAWTPLQPASAASTALIVPAAASRPRTASVGIARQVVREEIELQRRVTQDAQRQLHKLERKLSSREKEIQMLQQQLDKLRERQHSPTIQVTPVSSPAARAVSLATPIRHASDKVTATASGRSQPQAIPTLREQLASQDAYKKRLRHMLDRLARNVQLMAASEELSRQQAACATRERTLFADKLAQDRNVCRALETQRVRLLHQRQTFQQDSEHLLESYRDEIAARSEVGAQRQLADRRRHNLLQLMESRPSNCDGASSPTSSTTRDRHEVCPAEAVLRRSQLSGLNQGHLMAMNVARRSQRRNSAVLAADVSGRRESIFELYEAQYDRILTKTGESDAIRVLETFLGYSESQKRLAEIEQELEAESGRLEQEQQAHAVLLGRLRSSGIAEVEKRKKIRDYLEHVMHERQLEKVHAKDTFGEQAKLFLYIQQGVLNVADLLHCLEERTAVSTPSTAPGTATPTSISASSTAVVGGTRVPVVAGSVSVSEAAFTLSTLVHRALVVLRGEVSAASPLEFSIEQIGQLSRFMPDFQIDRLVNQTGVPTKSLGGMDTRDNQQSDTLDMRRQSLALSHDDGYEELERTDVQEVRRTIKRQEEQILKEVEVLFRTIDARRQRQTASTLFAAANSIDEDRQHQLLASALGSLSTAKTRQLPVTVYDMSPAGIHSALACPETEEAMREKLEAVHAFFREKREQDLVQLGDGSSTSTTRVDAVVNDDGVESRPPTRPLVDACKALANQVVKRKLLRRKGSMVARPSDDVLVSSNSHDLQHQQVPGQAAITASSGSDNQSQASSGAVTRSTNGGCTSTRSSPSAKAREIPRGKGSARTVRTNATR